MSAVAVESLLEGSGLVRKAAARDLLTGLGAKLSRASDIASPSARRETLVTRVPALDSLLSGGLSRGSFIEISGQRSCGRFSLGIATLAAATSAGESAALVDLGGHLDPQSAEASGVSLERLLWVRPSKLKEAVASAEMLLSAGFPLVVVDLGLPPVPGGCRRPAGGVSYCRGSAVGGRTVPDAAWVRLSRAARAHRAALFLLAPYRTSGIAAEAVLHAGSARALWRGEGRAPRLFCGIASRLTLAKDARARSGVAEELRLSIEEGRGGDGRAAGRHNVEAAGPASATTPDPMRLVAAPLRIRR